MLGWPTQLSGCKSHGPRQLYRPRPNQTLVCSLYGLGTHDRGPADTIDQGSPTLWVHPLNGLGTDDNRPSDNIDQCSPALWVGLHEISSANSSAPMNTTRPIWSTETLVGPLDGLGLHGKATPDTIDQGSPTFWVSPLDVPFTNDIHRRDTPPKP